jgi:hypothetical protein
VRVVPTPGLTEGEHLHPLSLGQFAIASQRPVRFGTIEAPIAGSPTLYPFDAYETGFQGALQIVNSRTHAVYPLDSRVAVVDEPAIQPLHSEALAIGLFESTATVILRLHRSATVKIYVLLLAAIPLVLAALIIIVISSQRRGRTRSFGPVELAGVGAVLLAILPIRQVLVPPGVTQLTFVDYLLGAEMAVIVAFACFAVSASLGRQHGGQADQSGDKGTKTA